MWSWSATPWAARCCSGVSARPSIRAIRVTGLYVIAAPFWGADDFWEWDEARLPEDAAEKLARVPRTLPVPQPR